MAKTPATLDLPAVRNQVNDLLDAHFKKRTSQAEVVAPEYVRLWHTIHQTALAGGKRLRPYLLCLSYTICGGRDTKLTIRVGTALELLHICMLIHDDIIDREQVRHGQPNVAGHYRQHYATLSSDTATTTHLADAAALLAGDLLLSDCYRLLLKAGLPAATAPAVFKQLDEAVFSVAGGQLLDTESPLHTAKDFDSLAVINFKTSIYSFAKPLVIGAILAGASKDTVACLEATGSNLGMAFQLTDDLLGVFGNEQQTGKSTMGDLREAKRTLLLQMTYQKAMLNQQQTITDILENHRNNPEKLADIKQIMIDCGAKAAVESMAEDCVTQAKHFMSKLQARNLDTAQLEAFANSLLHRTA